MSSQTCPHCGKDLTYWDFYGRNLRLDSFGHVRPDFLKSGDIFRCENEECEAYEQHFYTDQQSELHEGFPC